MLGRSSAQTIWRSFKCLTDRCPLAVAAAAHGWWYTQVGKNIVFYGGSDYFGEAIPQLLVFNTEAMRWAVPTEEVDLSEEAGGPRYGHTSTLVDMHPPRIVVFGGMVGGSTFSFEGNVSKNSRNALAVHRQKQIKGHTTLQEEPDNGVFVLECVRDSWSWSKPLVRGKKRPLARSEHTATKIAANKILYFGGWCEFPLNDVNVLDVGSWEWTQPDISGKAPSSRYRHTATLISSRLFIMGGSDNGDDLCELSKEGDLDVYVLDVVSWSWSRPRTSGKSPFPRSGHAACPVGNNTAIAIFGGKRNQQLFLSDVHVLDLETMAWSSLRSTGRVPPPLANMTLTPVGGGKCYVFGGTDSTGTCFNDIRVLEMHSTTLQASGSSAEAEQANLSFKVIIVGDSGVGKSAILHRFAQDVFDANYICTLGIDFSSKVIRVDDTPCKLEIWDTAGQERYSGITTSYYRGAQGAMLVYDVTSRESFQHVENWASRVTKYGGTDLEMVLVGNKVDLGPDSRQVPTSEAMELAKRRNIPFVETSAKTSANVQQAFLRMASVIKKRVEADNLDGIQLDMLQRKGTVRLSASNGSGGGGGGRRRQAQYTAARCCSV